MRYAQSLGQSMVTSRSVPQQIAQIVSDRPGHPRLALRLLQIGQIKSFSLIQETKIMPQMARPSHELHQATRERSAGLGPCTCRLQGRRYCRTAGVPPAWGCRDRGATLATKRD